MSTRRLPLLLAVVALLVRCDGNSDPAARAETDADRTPMPILTWFPTSSVTPSPTPARAVPSPIETETPLCGISVLMDGPFGHTAFNTAARECFLAAAEGGTPAQMLFVTFTDGDGEARLLTVSQQNASGTALMFTARYPVATSSRSLVSCAPLVPTGDEQVFEAPDCDETAEVGPRFDPTAAPDVMQPCGVSMSIHGRPAEDPARQCFLEAHEAGASARLFDVLVTVEGDPIVWIYTTSGETVSVYMDSHDDFGLQGEAGYECNSVERREPPDWFILNDCTEPQPIGSATARRGASPRGLRSGRQGRGRGGRWRSSLRQ